MTDRSVNKTPTMSPRTKKQLDEHKEIKREAILHAALHLFASKGIHATSVSNIAKRAGISKGLMYTYFTSKEDLVSALLENALNEILSVFDPDHDGVLTCQELQFFINGIFKNLRENQEHWKLYFMIMVQQPALDQLSNGYIVNKAMQIFPIVEKYLENKGFSNPKSEMLALHMLFDGIFFNFSFNPELVELEKIEDYLIQKYCMDDYQKV